MVVSASKNGGLNHQEGFQGGNYRDSAILKLLKLSRGKFVGVKSSINLTILMDNAKETWKIRG